MEPHYQWYHPLLMDEGLLPNGILPPTDFPHPEPSWFAYSKCSRMAIEKMSMNDPPIDNIPGALPPEDTSNKELVDSQQPDHTCTPDLPRQRLIGRKLEWKMQGENRIAKQLDCTTGIASTQDNGIHGIHFGPHTTFSRLNHSASTQKSGNINISGVDCSTSKSNTSNLQMPIINSSLKLILGLAVIVGLKMTHISLEHYTTGIFSNVSSSS